MDSAGSVEHPVASSSEHTNEHIASIHGEKFYDQLSDYSFSRTLLHGPQNY
jgi:hypothetical protein